VFILGCSNNGVNGELTCFLSKDYEIQSWNEQGEIFKKEGMLTIAFSYVSFCSHKDRKELYLIINIPYMVNVSEIDDYISTKGMIDVDLEKYAKWVKEIPKLKQKIDELEKKVNDLIQENQQLKEEIEKLRKENLRLKIISGEAKSGWVKERDLIRRPNFNTGNPEGYRCPFYFDFERVEYLNIFFNKEKGEQWCNFYHPYPNLNSSTYKFSMPHTGYLFLKGELPEQKKEKDKKTESIEIKDYNNFIKHVEKCGYFNYNFQKLEDVYNFLKGHKEETFQRKYFTGKCDISPRTVSKYLEMLKKCDLIIKLPGKGKHKVNIK